MEKEIYEGQFGKISYLRRKGDIPLVMIHGFTASSKIWDSMIRFLNPSFDVICPDLYGHGDTPFPESFNQETGKTGIQDMILFQCMAISDLLNNLGIKKFYLAGSSLGGWIAMEMVHRIMKPEKLILIDTAGSAPLEDSAYSHGIEQLLQEFAKENGKLFSGMIADIKPENFEVNDDLLNSLNMPVSVIWGKSDGIIDYNYGIKFFRKLPKARFYPVEGGHTPFVDKPFTVATIINMFLLNH
jgi:pimeloyl-ACP methyl ester carboxylesterase